MKIINVLTEGFKTSNGSAFLFPLLVHRKALKNEGIKVNLVNLYSPHITDCDVLFIDSKTFHKIWPKNPNYVFEKLHDLRETVTRPLYFDTTDSSGTIQSEVLPYVDKYFKNQLLEDKQKYRKQIYSGRIWSDYYHKTANIHDEIGEALDTPVSKNDLQKLRISWNSGLSDYSIFGPWKIALHERYRIPFLLRYPKATTSPSARRPKALSARFGATYSRATVRYQREQIRQLLGKKLSTDKLGRYAYMKELRRSKIVLAPFGWGEITLKDFEVFLTGGLLLKPSMNHIQTWPDFFQDGSTYLSHNWNLDDLEEKIDWAIKNTNTRIEIARTGQQIYTEHTSGPNAGELFAKRITEVLSQ